MQNCRYVGSHVQYLLTLCVYIYTRLKSNVLFYVGNIVSFSKEVQLWSYVVCADSS